MCVSTKPSSVILSQGGLGKVQFAVTTQHLLGQSGRPQPGCLCGSSGFANQVCARGRRNSRYSHRRARLQPKLALGETATQSSMVRLDIVAALGRGAHSGAGQSSFRGTALAGLPVATRVLWTRFRARQLHASTDALAVAWEGAGGARAAAFSQVPYVEVRGISDMADHDTVGYMEGQPTGRDAERLGHSRLVCRTPHYTALAAEVGAPVQLNHG